jgi:hypothetical protein
MNRSTSENLVSNLSSGRLLALTAPFVIDQDVLIGYALSPEEASCVNLPLNEFIALCPSLHTKVSAPRVFHGLKRIWEFLDQRGLRTDTHNHLDIHNITDLKLLA